MNLVICNNTGCIHIYSFTIQSGSTTNDNEPLLHKPFHQQPLLNPLTTQPPVQHLQASHWLVIWNHVSTGVQSHEGEVAGGLDGANLRIVAEKLEILERRLLVRLLAGPFELHGPGEVAEPVALRRELAYLW